MRRMLVDIPLPPKWKRLWEIWDLRGFIILSLTLQTFLILFAPFRKRTNTNWIIMPLWSAYLLADWAANFAVGLISNSQGSPPVSSSQATENKDLLAFWAPFLLVHLGGPDTITAFAMEDNELWLRHLFGLLFQCLAAVYVFIQSIPNNLWLPTMLMFMTGVIKYAERTRSLYLASADRFKDSMLSGADPGPNYAKLMDEYFSKRRAKLPTRIEMVPEPERAVKSSNKAKKGNLTELEVVQYAYRFFQTSKGLVVDLIFSRKERNQSRDFFLNRTAKDAFKVVEVELNFFYEVLFTKLPVVYGYFGALCRFFSLATVCLAIVFFTFKNKSNFRSADVTITYCLLYGALALDVTAIFMLVFSDWTIISLQESPDEEPNSKSIKAEILRKFLVLMTEGTLCGPSQPQSGTPSKTQTSTASSHPQASPDEDPNSKSIKAKILRKFRILMNKGTLCDPSQPQTGTPSQIQTSTASSHPQKRTWLIRLFKRRWSESISTFNLINYCLHPRSRFKQFVFDNLGLSGFFDSIKYVKPEKFTTSLKDFIFSELKSKSELGDDMETAKEISSARGDWVLRVEQGWSSLLQYTIDVDYDESLLLWHIATELCYNKELNTTASSNTENKYREIAKHLSDYMLYLLIMQPNMMSAIAGIGQIRFRDTCAEARRFFHDRDKENENESKSKNQVPNDPKVDLKQIAACMDILDVATEVPPVTVKGDRSKSLLFDGCILAKMLMKKTKEKDKTLDKWLIISKVWVELLCYAASHSRADSQAAQVSKGGELITIVWLLMAHFGLGDQFQINEGQARAKLIVGK